MASSLMLSKQKNANLGTRVSDLVMVVGSSSNKVAMSWPCGTETRQYTGAVGDPRNFCLMTSKVGSLSTWYVIQNKQLLDGEQFKRKELPHSLKADSLSHEDVQLSVSLNRKIHWTKNNFLRKLLPFDSTQCILLLNGGNSFWRGFPPFEV